MDKRLAGASFSLLLPQNYMADMSNQSIDFNFSTTSFFINIWQT